MKLKKIIVMGGTGLVCFSVSLILGWLKAPAPAVAQEEKTVEQSQTMAQSGSEQDTQIYGRSQSLTEKQLETLIFEVRERISDYEKRQEKLTLQEQRMRLARDEIQKDLESLNALRVELAGTVADIRRQQQSLEADVIRVSANQAVRLQQIAGIHDRMDSVSGGAMLINMCANGQMEDAVLILSYMQERTAANVMAEIVKSEPRVASMLYERLKKVTQEK